MKDDLELLIDAARTAGALALDRRTPSLEIEKKPDGSPVSSADLEVDAFLTKRLRGARPDYGWLSEETADDPARLSARRVFVVDPIDGTRAYIRGKPWFVVSLAVVEDGRPVTAAIYAPALDELYTAAKGLGAALNAVPVSASPRDRLEGAAMLGDAKMFAHPAWPKPWPPMQIEQRNAIAYRMALVACGAFDAAVAMSPKYEWDLAAGVLIANEAGAVAVDHKGRDLCFNTPGALCPSLVCAGPALAPLILAMTQPIELPT
jgi:myo-inositol-1(or 4)-monophosphatase